MTTSHLTTPALAADLLVARLASGERAWAQAPMSERRDLLLQVHANVAAHAEEWVRVAGQIKQLPAASPLLGEEWISGPWAVLGYAEALADTLARAGAGPRSAGWVPGRGRARWAGRRRRAAAQRVRPAAAQRLPGRGVDGTRRHRAGDRAQQAGLGLRTPEQTAGVARGDGRRQHLLDRAAGRALPALRPQPGGPAQAQPGHRRAAAGVRGGLRAVHRPRLPTHRHRRRHRRRPPGHPPRRRCRTHHRQRSHPRRDRLGHRRGRRRGQGGGHPAPGQADHQRTRRRLTRPSWCPAAGRRRTSASRPSTSPPSACTTAASTASPRRSSSSAPTGRRSSSSHRAARRVRGRARPTRLVPGLRRCGWPAPGRRTPSFEAVGGTPERTLLWNLDLADATESAFATEYFGPVLGVAELPGTGVEFLDAAVDAPTSACTARSART